MHESYTSQFSENKKQQQQTNMVNNNNKKNGMVCLIIKCPQGELIIFQGLVYKIDKLIYCQVIIAHDCPG